MSKKPKPKADEHNSFEDDGMPIGAGPGGDLDIFPMSELAERRRRRDEQDEITQYAIDHAGDPEEDPSDISDLDDDDGDK